VRDRVRVVHGSGFIWEGRDEDLDWGLKVLEKENELKNRGLLGPGPNDLGKIDKLGRIIEHTSEGVTWRGDPIGCWGKFDRCGGW
jgi:hypothetical protein